MPEPRGAASVKTMDAAKRRLFRPTAEAVVNRDRSKTGSDISFTLPREGRA